MRREKGSRKCHRCKRFTHEAMYLVRGREICATCGKEEILIWNQLVQGAEQHTAAGVLALCLVLGLVACSDDHGGDTVNAQGVQNCTVIVNGKEKPCH